MNGSDASAPRIVLEHGNILVNVCDSMECGREQSTIGEE